MVWPTLGSRTAKEQKERTENSQIGVADSKNVTVFDPVLTENVIRQIKSNMTLIMGDKPQSSYSLLNVIK